MIDLRYSKKNTPFVWASEIFNELGHKGVVATWFIEILRKGEFIINTHYWPFLRDEETADGRVIQVQDWSVRLDMAKMLLAKEENDRSRSLLNYLLFLENQRSEGELLSKRQIGALLEIAKVLGLFSVQKFLKDEHFNLYTLDSKPYGWWEYRAKLFGVTVDDIKAIFVKYNIKYVNQEQALFYIDRFELIRRATIDLFKVMGKSDTYAINVSDTVVMLAEEMNVRIYNDIGISLDFNTEKQRQTIHQLKNYKTKPLLLAAF